MKPEQFEKLGVFYLGRLYDLAREEALETPLLYESSDLTTHAVCVGMTGSGKTGLCIGLLEEAALDGVPAIAIDPKGDLGNLLLTFPELAPEDFRPWIQEDEARRAGVSAEAFAASQAKLWREGLASWGQSPDRIRRLREAAEFAIYTPGSAAGRPLSILSSLAAPGHAIRDDADLLGDRVSTTVTSLLALLDVDSDPVTGREHILLSNILVRAWRDGRDLDLESLIGAVQSPPFDRVGVIDLEAFYPAKERFELAMRLNALLASPGFAAWLEGEPLAIDRLLWTDSGKPRVSILSIAHLEEAERMFFVALLLNEIVGWTRTQPGTTSLRALVYMDEIAGYFPPVAKPPSKPPLLTLLKQARAFGVGVVLATQNPVDLDYKGLSNAGTWWIGRLQTERDKARVLEGLEGAAAGKMGFDRGAMEETLAGLGKRVFLMNDVHETGPVVFQTRWAMSYLRGPLTRIEIQRLTGAFGGAGDESLDEGATTRPDPETLREAAKVEADAPTAARAAGGARPVIPPEIRQLFVPPDGRATGAIQYRPALLGAASFSVATPDDQVVERRVVARVPLGDEPVAVRWNDAAPFELDVTDLSVEPEEGAGWAEVPAPARDPGRWRTWRKEFVDWVHRTRTVTLLRSPTLDEVSRPGEGERDFRIRLRQTARERRDAEKEALRKRYASKIDRLQGKVSQKERAVDRESDQARHHKLQTAISIGATLLGSVLGGRSSVGRATTAARGVGRAMKQSGDVDRAEETLAEVREELADMERELTEEIEALDHAFDPLAEELEPVELRPYKKDVDARVVALGWFPYLVADDATLTPAWNYRSPDPSDSS